LARVSSLVREEDDGGERRRQAARTDPSKRTSSTSWRSESTRATLRAFLAWGRSSSRKVRPPSARTSLACGAGAGAAERCRRLKWGTRTAAAGEGRARSEVRGVVAASRLSMVAVAVCALVDGRCGERSELRPAVAAPGARMRRAGNSSFALSPPSLHRTARPAQHGLLTTRAQALRQAVQRPHAATRLVSPLPLLVVSPGSARSSAHPNARTAGPSSPTPSRSASAECAPTATCPPRFGTSGSLPPRCALSRSGASRAAHCILY